VAGHFTEHAEAFVASDYQGETIQVFLFHRGKFLGFQCFAQDRLTIGGAAGMDLPLSECPEEEGYWDVYFSRGALYAWFRGPARGKGDHGPEDPRKVQPLDTFSVGDYRIQLKLLDGQGFAGLPGGDEEVVAEEGTAVPPEEVPPDEDPGPVELRPAEAREEQEAVLCAGHAEEPVPQEVDRSAGTPDQIEGISIDYARSIWTGVGWGAQAVEAKKEEPGHLEEPADLREQGEPSLKEKDSETETESVEADGLDYIQCICGLGREQGSEPEKEEAGEAQAGEPETVWEKASEADTKEEWIGFGLQEESPPEESVQREEAEPAPEAEEDLVSLAEEEDPDEGLKTGLEADPAGPAVDLQAPQESLDTVRPEVAGRKEPQMPGAGEAGGLVEGMSREERTKFWDDMAREAFANQNVNGVKAERGEALMEPPAAALPTVEPLALEEPLEQPLEGSAPSKEEVDLEEDVRPAREPAYEKDRFESAQAAAAVDELEIEEKEKEGWEDEEEEEDQDITYFSLVKEVFPSRTQDAKATYTGGRALEVVRFRGRDIQDIRYMEGGGAYTIRKGWNRSVWKRRGGPPPNFRLVRMKNGGLAELHVRESVNGRVYSEKGSKDLWELRGGKKRRFSLRGRKSWLPLPADTWALLRVNSGRYLVRYVSPRPKPAVQPLRPNVTMGQFKLVSLSMLSHILLILLVGLAVPDRTLEGYNRLDRFARIDPETLKALKPPPPPPKPKPVTRKEEVKPKPKPKPAVVSKHRVPRPAQETTPPMQAKAQAAGGGKKEVDVAQTGLLAALGGPDAGILDAKGNSEILLAAVTNLDAVAVPSDTTTFNLAGVAGKLATSEIQVPTSDAIETVGAAQLIKNGDGTLGVLASKGTGQVKGIVHEPPKAKISIQGGMSREAVLKVVTAHLDEVRDCYERELLHNPGISGKILMEWLIQLDGSVRYAKVKFTNIGHSSDLHSCIEAQVVTWNFPRPKGGQEVLVTFPFLFESMGF
jgi:hypothetical protein